MVNPQPHEDEKDVELVTKQEKKGKEKEEAAITTPTSCYGKSVCGLI